MTPDEHYREAERLLADGADTTAADADRLIDLAAAQVHATLATLGMRQDG